VVLIAPQVSSSLMECLTEIQKKGLYKAAKEQGLFELKCSLNFLL